MWVEFVRSESGARLPKVLNCTLKGHSECGSSYPEWEHGCLPSSSSFMCCTQLHVPDFSQIGSIVGLSAPTLPQALRLFFSYSVSYPDNVHGLCSDTPHSLSLVISNAFFFSWPSVRDRRSIAQHCCSELF